MNIIDDLKDKNTLMKKDSEAFKKSIGDRLGLYAEQMNLLKNSVSKITITNSKMIPDLVLLLIG
jgi:hypothetical protein